MIVYRVTIKRNESFFTEHSDAHEYAKVQLHGNENTSPVIDCIVILEKGWKDTIATEFKGE